MVIVKSKLMTITLEKGIQLYPFHCFDAFQQMLKAANRMKKRRKGGLLVGGN